MGVEKLLAEIGKQVNQESISRKCSGDSCRVYLTGVPSPRTIVDLECEFEQRQINTKRCDYALFYINVRQNSLDIVLIELKSGTFKAPTVINQLQKGADFIMEMLEKLPEIPNLTRDTFEITCIPVLFHGKGIDRFQLSQLERAKVRFQNRNIRIRRSKCGQAKNLALVLKKRSDFAR